MSIVQDTRFIFLFLAALLWVGAVTLPTSYAEASSKVVGEATQALPWTHTTFIVWAPSQTLPGTPAAGFVIVGAPAAPRSEGFGKRSQSSQELNVVPSRQARDAAVAGPLGDINTPTPTPTPEPGDVNADGKINSLDLFQWSFYWQQNETAYSRTSDLNGDHHIDEKDLLLLMDRFSAK